MLVVRCPNANPNYEMDTCSVLPIEIHGNQPKMLHGSKRDGNLKGIIISALLGEDGIVVLS